MSNKAEAERLARNPHIIERVRKSLESAPSDDVLVDIDAAPAIKEN